MAKTTRKPRGNDAIPTWSGFNYQGKAMLLCVLEQINKDINSIQNYKVELEKVEDFAFLKESNGTDEYISFYQVKAYTTTNVTNRYREAITKLNEHRNNHNHHADAYLVLVKMPNDWNVSTLPKTNNVMLYQYNNSVVGVKEIKNKIISEIGNLIQKQNLKSVSNEAIYGNLCILIDEKVADAHSKQCKNRDYIIPFKDIYQKIIDSLNQANIDAQAIFNEKLYEWNCEYLKKSVDEFCQENCGTDPCPNENCCVKYVNNKILNLSIEDFKKYIKILNPTESEDWEKTESYIRNFSKENIKNYICELFFQSKDVNLIEVQDAHIGIKADVNPIKKGVMMPTFVDLSNKRRSRSSDDSIQIKLKKIADNSEISNELNNNSIVVECNIDIPMNQILEAKISNSWNKSDKDQICSYPYEIGIITYNKLYTYFEERNRDK